MSKRGSKFVAVLVLGFLHGSGGEEEVRALAGRADLQDIIAAVASSLFSGIALSPQQSQKVGMLLLLPLIILLELFTYGTNVCSSCVICLLSSAFFLYFDARPIWLSYS